MTKFWLDGSNKAITAHETKALKGLTLDVTKLFMPRTLDGIPDKADEFGIPIYREQKEQSEDSVSEESSLPSFVTEPEEELS